MIRSIKQSNARRIKYRLKTANVYQQHGFIKFKTPDKYLTYAHEQSTEFKNIS
jgi:hypothetical protein